MQSLRLQEVQVGIITAGGPMNFERQNVRAKNGMLIMGHGVHSMAECYTLHEKLSRAIRTLSGLQQGAEEGYSGAG